MANWDDLPADIWRLIFQKVITLISDHIPFSGVCKLWRSIGLDYRTTKFPTNVPALIIPGGTTTTTQTRRLLAFPVGKVINNQGQDLPVLSAPHESLCRGSHQGLCKVGDKDWKLIEGPKPWGYIDGIFFSDEFYVVDYYGKIYISDQLDSLHPKLKELAPPPPCSIPYVQQWYLVESGGELHHILREIDLSGDYAESIVDDHDIDGGQHDDDDVNEEEDGGSSENDDESDVDDQNDHGGQHNEEEDGSGSENDDQNPDAGSETSEFDEFDYDNNYHTSVRNCIQKTTAFRVFKLETSSSEPKWIGVKDLDGGAIFLGLNQSFALSKSNLMGHRGDRIYYTDDDICSHKLHVYSGHDMGVFNLEDSKFETLCLTESESVKPPAVWITPMP
ncbi:hypothetical protein Vadar_006202 [Vaccinium darrowii]|uniref:Uncharacterized protein n=1 Tax=Vaccinium darrowii TaxID=229202 RepID=A0ACB7YD01_9ERIC|nr:hypothetical protein Vadar_006202 [Vaccinium darrowii]